MDLEQPGQPDSAQQIDAGGQPQEVIANTDLEPIEGQQAQEEEFEEIELDDGMRKVPKSLKDYVMRQKDYTLKTQELADHRRAVDAERQQIAQRQQFQQAHFEDVVQLRAMDLRMQQFQKIDWSALSQADHQRAQELRWEFDSLKEARNQQAQKIAQNQQRLGLETTQEAARRIQQAQAELARDIPSWSKPEVRQAVMKTCKAAGYTDEMLERTDFAPFIKLAHKAHLYDQLVKERSKPAEPAKPTTTVAGASKATTGYSPTMTDAQFAKMRRAQIAQRNAH